MLRFHVFVLLLIAAVCPDTARAANALTDLRFELESSESLDEQLDVVERMRALLHEHSLPENQVNVMIYGLTLKPVFAEEAVMSLLREMIATPEIADTTITAIANQFGGTAMDERSTPAVGDMLSTWHRQRGLPDAAIAALTRALKKGVPRVRREYALEILTARPLSGPQQLRFLHGVADLLEPEVTAEEKLRALDILMAAAETRELPRDALNALYKVATRETDDEVRLASWPFVLPQSAAAGNKLVFGMGLARQLTSPGTAGQPSFAGAEESLRERAVSQLIDYWHPDYPRQFIDALIEIVAQHGSETAVRKLEALRRVDALNDKQLGSLAAIDTRDASLQRVIETITIPNLAVGSLVGPMEVIAYSRDAAERAAATQQLLDRYPSGQVPLRVAEAAYEVMTGSDAYDAAAVALVARGDEPFDTREAKILRTADGSSQRSLNAVRALQHLHGDVGLDFLVRHYANDESLAEPLRATIVSMLYMEVRDSGELDDETAASVLQLARSADSYTTVDIATRLLRTAGLDVPLSARLREKDLQWKILGWGGIATLVLGLLAGLALLLLVALPRSVTGLDRRQRFSGLGLFLLLGTLFVGACGIALLHSVGHNYTPPPDQAAPYYLAAFALAVLLAATTLRLGRRGRGKTI